MSSGSSYSRKPARLLGAEDMYLTLVAISALHHVAVGRTLEACAQCLGSKVIGNITTVAESAQPITAILKRKTYFCRQLHFPPRHARMRAYRESYVTYVPRACQSVQLERRPRSCCLFSISRSLRNYPVTLRLSFAARTVLHL